MRGLLLLKFVFFESFKPLSFGLIQEVILFESQASFDKTVYARLAVIKVCFFLKVFKPLSFSLIQEVILFESQASFDKTVHARLAVIKVCFF